MLFQDPKDVITSTEKDTYSAAFHSGNKIETIMVPFKKIEYVLHANPKYSSAFEDIGEVIFCAMMFYITRNNIRPIALGMLYLNRVKKKGAVFNAVL